MTRSCTRHHLGPPEKKSQYENKPHLSSSLLLRSLVHAVTSALVKLLLHRVHHPTFQKSKTRPFSSLSYSPESGSQPLAATARDTLRRSQSLPTLHSLKVYVCLAFTARALLPPILAQCRTAARTCTSPQVHPSAQRKQCLPAFATSLPDGNEGNIASKQERPSPLSFSCISTVIFSKYVCTHPNASPLPPTARAGPSYATVRHAIPSLSFHSSRLHQSNLCLLVAKRPQCSTYAFMAQRPRWPNYRHPLHGLKCTRTDATGGSAMSIVRSNEIGHDSQIWRVTFPGTGPALPVLGIRVCLLLWIFEEEASRRLPLFLRCQPQQHALAR